MSEDHIRFGDGFDTTETALPPEGVEDQKGGKKGRLKNTMAGSGRSLTIVGLVVFAMFGGAIYLIHSVFKSNQPKATAQVNAAPQESQDMGTAVGADPKYTKMVQQQNAQRVQQAEHSGSDAIPTLTSNVSIDTPPPEPPAETNGCNTKCQQMKDALAKAQEQAAAAEAEAKKLREQAAARQAGGNGEQNALRPDQMVYQGHVYMTPAAVKAREQAIAGEMRQISAVVTGGEGHGFAKVADSGATSTQTAGSPAGSGAIAASHPVTGGGSVATVATTASEPEIIHRSDTIYATLVMTANSDVPGPIMAIIPSGKFAGARVLGSFTVKDTYLVMQFTSLTLKNGVSYPINAIGVNPGTRMTGMADSVDSHTFEKVAAIFGAAFLQGFGNAVLQSGQVTTNGLTTQTTSTLSTTRLQAEAALGQVGQAASQFLQPYATRKATVIKYADTGLVLLFLGPVKQSQSGN